MSDKRWSIYSRTCNDGFPYEHDPSTEPVLGQWTVYIDQEASYGSTYNIYRFLGHAGVLDIHRAAGGYIHIRCSIEDPRLDTPTCANPDYNIPFALNNWISVPQVGDGSIDWDDDKEFQLTPYEMALIYQLLETKDD